MSGGPGTVQREALKVEGASDTGGPAGGPGRAAGEELSTKSHNHEALLIVFHNPLCATLVFLSLNVS